MTLFCRALAALLLVFAVQVPLIAGVAASQPLHETFHLDETRIFESPCGFPIEEHLFGTERISLHFDSNGDVTRGRFSGSNLRLRFMRLDTGSSVETPLNSTAHVVWEADGAQRVRITGLHGHLVVPGQGVVEQESGLVLVVDLGSDDGAPTVEQVSGRFDGPPGPFPELCDALSA